MRGHVGMSAQLVVVRHELAPGPVRRNSDRLMQGRCMQVPSLRMQKRLI